MAISTSFICPKVGKRIESVRNRHLLENRRFFKKLKLLCVSRSLSELDGYMYCSTRMGYLYTLLAYFIIIIIMSQKFQGMREHRDEHVASVA